MSPIPPTSAQSKLLLHHRLFPGDASFNIGQAFRIRGQMDLRRLAGVIEKVLTESVALNVTFSGDICLPNAGAPRVMMTRAPIAASAQEEADAIATWVGDVADRPFSPETWPLYQIDVHNGRYANYLTIVWSHLISDAATLLNFGQVTSELYAGRSLSDTQIRALGTYPCDYHDPPGSGDNAVAAFRQMLAGVERLTHEQLTVTRTAEGVLPGRAIGCRLDPRLATAVRTSSLVARSGAYPLFLAAHAVLLSGLSGESNVAIGVPMANRYRRDGQWRAFGYFVNTLPMAVDLDSMESFSELYNLMAARVRTMLRYRSLDLTANASAVFERRPPSSLHYDNTCTYYYNESPFTIDDCTVDILPVPRRHIIYPLATSVRDTGDGYEVTVECTDSIAVADPVACLERIVRAAVADPGIRPAHVGLVDSAPTRLPRTAPVVASSLDEWFRKTALQHANRVAVTDESGQWTYAELNAAAEAVAQGLSSHDCGRYVAVAMRRRRELIAVLLGILRAGCAYVPLDPKSPAQRIEAIIGQLPQVWLVADDDVLPGVVVPHRVSPSSLLNTGAAVRAPSADDPAYVIFTSGSTGLPKGVEISHGNVMRLFTSTKSLFDFGAADVWCLFHSYAFDFSVWELFGALLYGGRLVIPSEAQVRSPEDFGHLLAREGVTVLNQTPPAFRRLTEVLTHEVAQRLSVRWVVFGGDVLRFDDLSSWLSLVGERAKLVNMYGITEITVHATFHVVEPSAVGTETASVIGVPLPDLSIAIVDRHLRRCPTSVPGEILVSGPGVARGYVGRPDLTAQKFLTDTPYGDWVYRSGDRGYLRPDGTLVYLNRIDRQVKVRGYRIEPAEVEAELSTLDGIKDVHVGVLSGPGEESKLVAWLVADDEMTDLDLRTALRARLPLHMIPSSFARVSQLPLNINGKVDVAALPSPDAKTGASTMESDDPTIHAVARIWAEVIQCGPVGADDNFFDVGGNSMHVTEIHRRLTAGLGADLTIVDLFEHHTPRELAIRINGVAPTAPARAQRRQVGTAAQRNANRKRELGAGT